MISCQCFFTGRNSVGLFIITERNKAYSSKSPNALFQEGALTFAHWIIDLPLVARFNPLSFTRTDRPISRFVFAINRGDIDKIAIKTNFCTPTKSERQSVAIAEHYGSKESNMDLSQRPLYGRLAPTPS